MPTKFVFIICNWKYSEQNFGDLTLCWKTPKEGLSPTGPMGWCPISVKRAISVYMMSKQPSGFLPTSIRTLQIAKEEEFSACFL